MSSKMIITFLIMGLLSILAQSTGLLVTNYVGAEATRPVCQSPGTFGWAKTTPVDEIIFDWTSSVINPATGDSLGIYVSKGGDGTDTFKFKFLSPSLETLYVQECLGTEESGTEFVALLNQYLFLKTATAYKVCRMEVFDILTTTTVPTLTITLPATSITGTVTKFVPFFKRYSNGDSLIHFYVSISDGTDSGVFQWAYPASPANGDALTTSGLVGIVFAGQAFDQMIGTDDFFYEPVTRKFVFKDNAADTTWTNDPVVIAATSIVKQYKLDTFEGFISIMDVGGTTGAMYSAVDQALTEIPYADSITLPVLDFTDDVKNIFRLTDVEVLWITLDTGKYQFRSNIPVAQFAWGTQVLDIILSGDKAFIFSTGKIQYFKHVAANNVKLIYEKTITTELDLTEASFTYEIKVSCMCEGIRRFVCYSSTLNCLIIKKAAPQCYVPDNMVPNYD